MKRRNFLKAMGAAIVAPTALLKGRPKYDPASRWKRYYVRGEYDPKLVDEMRKAFKNTEFVPPVTYKGVPLVYIPELLG